MKYKGRIEILGRNLYKIKDSDTSVLFTCCNISDRGVCIFLRRLSNKRHIAEVSLSGHNSLLSVRRL